MISESVEREVDYKIQHKKANPLEATVTKCRPYALFLYKNAFFPKIIWSYQKKAVPLHPLSKKASPDGGIGRRAGLKHQ